MENVVEVNRPFFPELISKVLEYLDSIYDMEYDPEIRREILDKKARLILQLVMLED